MEKETLDSIMHMSVNMTAETLTDDELNSLCLVALVGADPQHVEGYEKAKSLFTESNGTRMHQDTLDVLCTIRNKRIGL